MSSKKKWFMSLKMYPVCCVSTKVKDKKDPSGWGFNAWSFCDVTLGMEPKPSALKSGLPALILKRRTVQILCSSCATCTRYLLAHSIIWIYRGGLSPTCIKILCEGQFFFCFTHGEDRKARNPNRLGGCAHPFPPMFLIFQGKIRFHKVHKGLSLPFKCLLLKYYMLERLWIKQHWNDFPMSKSSQWQSLNRPSASQATAAPIGFIVPSLLRTCILGIVLEIEQKLDNSNWWLWEPLVELIYWVN